MKIKVFDSKTGKKCVALVYESELKEYLISFDIGLICEISDMTPSQIARLDTGYYNI